MTDYDPTIPAATQNLLTSQGQMLNNFSELNTIFDYNHFTWNDAVTADRGKHRKVEFPEPLTSDPSPTGDDGVLYTKAVSGIGQLFFANASAVDQLTGINGTFAAEGSATFPNGLIMKWGKKTSVSNNSAVVYPTPFPTAVWSVQVSGGESSGTQPTINLSANAADTNGFTLKISTGSTDIFYFALGN